MLSEIKTQSLAAIFHTAWTYLYDSTWRCHQKQKTGGKACQKEYCTALRMLLLLWTAANLEIKSRKRMLDSRILYGNAVLYITIVQYITNINVEYALGSLDPHRVLGPLPCLYKKASFYCLYSNRLLAVCQLWDLQMTDSYWGMDINWTDFTWSTSVFVLPRKAEALLSYKRMKNFSILRKSR